MTPELRERLMQLNADRASYDLKPDVAVWLACDLLLAGVDTPATAELAGESPTRLSDSDAGDLVRRMLTELDIPVMTQEDAEWWRARIVANRMLATEEWRGDTYPFGMLVPDDRFYELLYELTVEPEKATKELRELAEGIIEQADARLTRW